MKLLKLLIFSYTLSACSAATIHSTADNFIFADRTGPAHMLYAAEYIGYHERTNRSELIELIGIDPTRIEWCAAFINSILEESNIPGSESVSNYSLMARSFLDWGEAVDEPEFGDIVIFRRGTENWQGHVGFYVNSYNRNGVVYYRILGGNQNNSVNISEYPARRSIAVRRTTVVLQEQRLSLISQLRNVFQIFIQT